MRDVRSGTSASVASIIESLLDRSLKEKFATEKLIVQVAWNIDNFDTWQKGDMHNLKEAISYIANELRPKVFSVQLIGPGRASASLTEEQMKNGGQVTWDSFADQIKAKWSAHGMNRKVAVEIVEKLPLMPGQQRSVT